MNSNHVLPNVIIHNTFAYSQTIIKQILFHHKAELLGLFTVTKYKSIQINKGFVDKC